MRRVIALAGVGVLAASLQGCATPGRELLAQSNKALADAPVCCATIATAKRQPLPVQPVEVVVDQTAQAFDFGGNKAFFVLYELPAFTDTYSIVIVSQAQGTVQDTALLVPRVATFDADFKLQRYYDEKTLRNRGDNVERTVFLNPANRAERYIAIYGSDPAAAIERAYSMATVTPVSTGYVTFNIYSGVDGKSTLRSAPAGKLKIEVQGLQPAKP